MATKEESNTSDSLFSEEIHAYCRLPVLDENLSDEVKIGSGGFGKVYRFRDRNTGQFVAVKLINMAEWSETVPSAVIREISLLRELYHPNIVRLLDVKIRGTHVNLVFENLDRDLCDFINSRKNYSTYPLIVKSFMHQMLSALSYCHDHKILHRDLKPRNVLVNVSNRIVKLADFGLARPFGETETAYTKDVGTSGYKALEISFHSEEYTAQIDVWSLGCVFSEMIDGNYTLFEHRRFEIFGFTGEGDELEVIFSVLGTPTEETWPGVTRLCSSLPKYRQHAPMDLAQTFPLLEPDGLNLLSQMLVLDPTKRISAKAALNHPYFKNLNSDQKGKSSSHS